MWRVKRNTEDEAQFEKIWQEISERRWKESRDSFKRGYISNEDLLKRLPLGYFALLILGGFSLRKGITKVQGRARYDL